jgi:hypothetical protein
VRQLKHSVDFGGGGGGLSGMCAAIAAARRGTRVVLMQDRLVRLDIDIRARAIRFVPEATWGAECAHLFAWDVDG